MVQNVQMVLFLPKYKACATTRNPKTVSSPQYSRISVKKIVEFTECLLKKHEQLILKKKTTLLLNVHFYYSTKNVLD